MPRTAVLIADHLDPIVARLTATLGALPNPIPVGFGQRPIDITDKKLHEPPYVVVTYIKGGTMDGPLSDTQVDISMRILISCMGNSAREATVLRDIVHADMMDTANFTITNRKIRDIKVEVPSDGAFRDDDVPTPIFYTLQIYLLDTVPA